MRDKDFEGLIEAFGEVRDHQAGKDIPGLKIHVPAEIDTKAIRKRLNLSQTEFAARYSFSAGAVRDWEQGRRCPDPATRAYLKVIAHNPGAVQDALAEPEMKLA